MRIAPIPCLRDNYAYLLVDDETRAAVAVDPSEDGPVRARLEVEGATLAAIWLTHHHWDHVGGVESLAEAHPGIEIVGSRYDLENRRIARQTRGVGEGDALAFGGAHVRILDIPGHTLGAIAYVAGDADVFTGDTLFIAGCGRVFEGTMEMMARSLAKLRALDPATRVWCGHEYTVKNLEFARTVEPESAAVSEALEAARAKRDAGEPTVPGTIRDELRTNPFLRYDLAELARGRGPVESFTALREAKDRF